MFVDLKKVKEWEKKDDSDLGYQKRAEGDKKLKEKKSTNRLRKKGGFCCGGVFMAG